MDNIFERSLQLIGEENFKVLKNAKVCVIGLGGVGGTALMSLVRSGVSNFLLIDFDNVSLSNLNRQIFYDTNDIGKFKTDICFKKIKSISPDCTVERICSKVDDNFSFEKLLDYDFIIDAIDDIKAKKNLIKFCIAHNLNLVSSLGMGNRLSPENIKITTLDKTYNDPLAKKLRYELRKDGVDIKKVHVCFCSSDTIKSNIISSMIFTPSTAGLLIGYYVVNFFIDKYNNS